ncbi:MAG: TauD/TfdA family dioxygenase [Gammaproteobacteria bacterium]|nr:TauD/TfdA family dioxygenase [Gammaproteobacteria bacterium]
MRNDQVQVRPLTGVIGAEIEGIDLRKPLDDEAYERIHGALLEHLVVFFRDQDLSPEQHLALGERFGELHLHPAAPCIDGRPELMKIHADATSSFVEGTSWHTDVSSDEEPPMGSILHLTTVPKLGGDTLFASMYAAYDALSDTMKEALDPLYALHTSDVHLGRYESVGGGLRRDKWPESEHPVIRTHPETGRKLIYVNKPFTKQIVGMKPAESDAILNFLYAHNANPQFQCRFRWEKNSIAFWDNRCTQHHATWDYYPETRSGIRVTIKGDRPFH